VILGIDNQFAVSQTTLQQRVLKAQFPYFVAQFRVLSNLRLRRGYSPQKTSSAYYRERGERTQPK
jgi:hypothetical protein